MGWTTLLKKHVSTETLCRLTNNLLFFETSGYGSNFLPFKTQIKKHIISLFIRGHFSALINVTMEKTFANLVLEKKRKKKKKKRSDLK